MNKKIPKIAEGTSLRLTHATHILTDDILYLEADWNYTIVYTADNRQHMSSFNLAKLEARIMASNFLRISRGCLININFLKEIKIWPGNTEACLSNGSVHNISRRKFEGLKDILYARKFLTN